MFPVMTKPTDEQVIRAATRIYKKRKTLIARHAKFNNDVSLEQYINNILTLKKPVVTIEDIRANHEASIIFLGSRYLNKLISPTIELVAEMIFKNRKEWWDANRSPDIFYQDIHEKLKKFGFTFEDILQNNYTHALFSRSTVLGPLLTDLFKVTYFIKIYEKEIDLLAKEFLPYENEYNLTFNRATIIQAILEEFGFNVSDIKKSKFNYKLFNNSAVLDSIFNFKALSCPDLSKQYVNQLFANIPYLQSTNKEYKIKNWRELNELRQIKKADPEDLENFAVKELSIKKQDALIALQKLFAAQRECKKQSLIASYQVHYIS